MDSFNRWQKQWAFPARKTRESPLRGPPESLGNPNGRDWMYTSSWPEGKMQILVRVLKAYYEEMKGRRGGKVPPPVQRTRIELIEGLPAD